MSIGKTNGFNDFICFLDDHDQKITIFVKILEVGNSVAKFLTKEGNVVSIPIHRVLKIKQKNHENSEVRS